MRKDIWEAFYENRKMKKRTEERIANWIFGLAAGIAFGVFLALFLIAFLGFFLTGLIKFFPDQTLKVYREAVCNYEKL